MIITRIEKQNEAYFLPFLHEAAREERDGLLRIGAVLEDGTIVGAAAALMDPATMEILSVYVLPEYRRKGFGTELLETLEKVVSAVGASSISTELLFDVENMAFLQKAGFSFFYDYELCYIPLGVLLRSQKFKNAVKQFGSPNSRALSKATAGERNMIRHYLAARDLPSEGDYEKEYSVFTAMGENRIRGITLMGRREGGMEFLWQSFEDTDPKEGMDHLVTIVNLLDRREEKSGSLKLYFSSEKEKLPKLISYFAGNEGYIRREGIYMRGVRLI